MPVTIRPATPADAEALLSIYAPYVEHTAITFEYDVPSVDEFRQRIINTLQLYPYLVAERTTDTTNTASDTQNASSIHSTSNIQNTSANSGNPGTSCPEILGYAYAGPLHARAAYAWSVETSIYVKETERKSGVGKILYAALEKALKAQNVTNVNACIASPQVDDEYLNHNSIQFHEHLGYSMVGEFHKCAYKFGRWYNMVWMEKMIGEHQVKQPDFIPFSQIIPGLSFHETANIAL